VFEYRMLRETIGSKGEEGIGGWRYYIMRSFTVCSSVITSRG